MPEIVPHRVGSLFYHRDTRLAQTGHPVIVKSVDVTDLSPLFERRMIRFEYGYGGDERLYVEIQLYRPQPHLHWAHRCFDVASLAGSDLKRDELMRLARDVRVSRKRLVSEILRHAPSMSLDIDSPHVIVN